MPPLLAAVRGRDIEAVSGLLAGGANPRVGDGLETPLHAAARRGPRALVEVLLAGGALEWAPDAAGRTPLDVARQSRAREKPAIVALLDRKSISDRSFRAAVDAIHAGDDTALGRLLDREPRLLRDRIVEPDAYRLAGRHQYFLDPKLFWFVANNPTLIERMPDNIVAVAHVMIDRHVDRADLDYALELTMSGRIAREQGHQIPLMRTLLAAGATASRASIVVTAAYRELDALRALLELGYAMSAPIAAALGANEPLRDLFADAGPADIATAFGLAVINGHVEAARLALDAGADVNEPLPVHGHSTALHQAANDDNLPMIELLLTHGANAARRDALWDATPLDWANYFGRSAARTALGG